MSILWEVRILKFLASDACNGFTIKLKDVFFNAKEGSNLHELCLVTDYAETSLAGYLDEVGELDVKTAKYIT
jgi:hypothetical protein